MNKNNNKGCLSGLVGTLIVIVGVVIFAIFSSLINNLLLGVRFGDRSECALLPLSIPIIGLAFVLFEAVFIAWEIKLNKKGSEDEPKYRKIFLTVSVICFSLAVSLPFISASTYTRLSDDKISKTVCFVEYKSYDIDTDLSRCTLACDANGNLTFTVTMRDGEKIDLFGNVNSCGKGFIDEYENLYGYAAHLTKKLCDRGLYPTVIGDENMQMYKDTHPEVWKYLDEIITATRS